MFTKIVFFVLIIVWGLAAPAAAQKIENQMPAATCESTVTLSFRQPMGTFEIHEGLSNGNDEVMLTTTYYIKKVVRKAVAHLKLKEGFKVYGTVEGTLISVIKGGVERSLLPKNLKGLKSLVLMGAINLDGVSLQSNSKKDGVWRLWWSFKWELFEKPYKGPQRRNYTVGSIRIGPQAVRHGAPLPKSTWDIRKLSGTEVQTVTKWRTCISDIRGHLPTPPAKK